MKIRFDLDSISCDQTLYSLMNQILAFEQTSFKNTVFRQFAAPSGYISDKLLEGAVIVGRWGMGVAQCTIGHLGKMIG